MCGSSHINYHSSVYGADKFNCHIPVCGTSHINYHSPVCGADKFNYHIPVCGSGHICDLFGEVNELSEAADQVYGYKGILRRELLQEYTGSFNLISSDKSLQEYTINKGRKIL